MVHQRILKDHKTPQQFNQGITKGLDMDGGYDKIIQEAKALLHDYTNPYILWPHHECIVETDTSDFILGGSLSQTTKTRNYTRMLSTLENSH
jgi:hypothetical protein